MIHPSGRSRFENDWGSFPSWLKCVSWPDVHLSRLVFMISTAFAVALGIFHENKGRSWSRAANMAMMRYLICQKWDIHMLRSFIGVTTTQAYQAWAAQEKLEALTDILPEKTKLHWIGPRPEGSQSRVLLHFFGESWLVSVVCVLYTLLIMFQNAIRRGLQLASTTRLFPLPTHPSKSWVCLLRQF